MTRKKEQERFMSYITERQTHESRMAVADFLRKYADPVSYTHLTLPTTPYV